MKSLSKKFWGGIRRFDRDQRGMEALQVVMILAVAAVVGVGIFSLVKYGVNWANDEIETFTKEASPNNLPPISYGSSGNGGAADGTGTGTGTDTAKDNGDTGDNSGDNSGSSVSFSAGYQGHGFQIGTSVKR